MLGAPFYFSLIRKYVILMGSALNSIHITRSDKEGNNTVLIRVPITYAPKDKMLARVIQDTAIDRKSATIPLPAISFELGQMVYDGSRKLNTIGRSVVKNTDANKLKYQYNPVPYDINFKVFVYAKNAEDGTKILEQILPYFTPAWTTTVHLIPEMDVTMDIPIILNNVTYEDNYDGEFTDRRAIIWTLDFVVKAYLYGPIRKSNIIKFINTNFYIPKVPDGQLPTAIGKTEIAEKATIQPGLTPNGNPIHYYGGPNSNTGTIAYTEIEADDDYGFITMVYTHEDEQQQQ